MQRTKHTFFIMGRYAVSFLLLATVLVSASLGHAERSSQVSEYDLKAVYLYNFLHFVHWPASLDDTPKLIGVVGKSPIGDSLYDLQRKLKNSRKQEIELIFYGFYEEGMDLSSCNLLYVADSERGNFDNIVASLTGSPVLTVADFPEFLNKGGMITFVKSNKKILWSVNRRPVQQAGLRLSSKLLEIAVEVISIP